MRIRQLKPDYWKDSKLHNTVGITAEVREFYIGLWGIADDYGYFRWDIPEVASELYRYRSAARRERQVEQWMRLLVALERIRILDCGHAVVVNLAKHQKVGGTKSQTYLLEHQKCTAPPTSAEFAERPDVPPTSASNGKGKGTVGNVTESNGRRDQKFHEALARARAKAGEAA